MPIGEAVLSAFMQALFDKVIASAISELKFPRDVTEELQILASSLSTVQAHVEDAEERQLKDKVSRSWLAKLKEVAYEMDDLLDEYAAEALRSKIEGPSNHDRLKKSTQRSEGFNAVLKKYVNPNMFVLHFVRQYQKIQDKCLVAQDGQDFRTDGRDRRSDDGGVPPSITDALTDVGPTSASVGNPPRSKVKGRKKEKRLKKGMNAELKRKNKCGFCKLTGHNAARCPEKLGGEGAGGDAMAAQ
ncbi:disease resistance protein RGA2-like [Panicum miliaceum]|uniref:Disease resistance protein RGA2-like n=1 Tax=Panicum miliaceum TaxID=4540 RepID=A0A3L6SZW7_PANMI|nr:disease resistance protein RGA2-like [Panicum miliaceum]